MSSERIKIILTGQGGSYICSLPMEKKDSQVAAPFVGALAGTKQAFSKKGNTFRLSMEDKELAVVKKGKFELSMVYPPGKKFLEAKKLLSEIADYIISVFKTPENIHSRMFNGDLTEYQLCRSLLKLVMGKVGTYSTLNLKTYIENVAQYLYERNELKTLAMYFIQKQYPILKDGESLQKTRTFLKKALELSNNYSPSNKSNKIEQLLDCSGKAEKYESKILQKIITYRILKLSNSHNTIEEISKQIGKDVEEQIQKLVEKDVLEVERRFKYPIDTSVITL